ncbi:sodium-dependent glucose transporter 1A-like [Argopecten irradians]|uniref:sodium-dependent glucose transporter 1A-like n=1 Tax=Argopecten irradians TaxID=31199 RepID=UPI00371D66D3
MLGKSKSKEAIDQIPNDGVCEVAFLPYKEQDEFDKPRQPRILTEKLIYTACLCSAFFVFGWTYEQMGPALLDLQHNTGVTFTLASVYMMAVNIAHIAGSLGASVLYGRLSTCLILGVSIVGVALAMAIIPWCTEFLPMLIGHCVQGLFGGSVDSVVLAEMLSIWGSNSESPMQALYFSFAFGAILSPLVVTPFLQSNDETGSDGLNGSMLFVAHSVAAENVTETTSNDLSNNFSYAYTTMFTITNDVINNSSNTSTPFHDVVTLSPDTDCVQMPNMTFENCSYMYDQIVFRYSSDLYIPYSISSGLCVIVSIPFLTLFSLSLLKKFRVSHVDEDIRVEKHSSKKMKAVTLLVTGLISGIDTAMEDAYGDFLTAFCVSQMGWTKQNGAMATSLFHGSFAFGRFIGIFLAIRFKPLQLVISYSILLIAVNGVFILSGLYGFSNVIWVCSVLAGIGMSIISPSIFTLTEESFFPVTGKIASYYVITACLGSAINSFLIGYLMDSWSQMSMLYVLCIEGFIIFSMALVCYFLLRVFYKEEPSDLSEDHVEADNNL